MLRKVRSEDPGITIILPGEKRKVSNDEIDSVVKIKASVIKLEFECGIYTWRAEGTDSKVKQMKKLIKHHYLFDEDPDTETQLDEVIESVLMTDRNTAIRKYEY